MSRRLSPALGSQVSRREIALSPLVWWAVAASFAIFCVSLIVISQVLPVLHPVALAAFGGFLGAIAIILGLRPPPEPDAAITHVVIALAYAGTAAAMVLMAPYPLVPLPVAIFAGTLSAVWLDDRREMAAHGAAALLVLVAASVAGHGGWPVVLATLTLVPSTWVLGWICLWVLETAERQSDRLEAVAMRDPLTGAGNRRLLEMRLASELTRAAATNRPLSVLALDLDGFKPINDALGHAAGDRLLVHVAEVLMRLSGPRATVVRQGGDEFCLVLPETGPAAAAELAARIRSELDGIVGTGIGIAGAPADGRDPDRILELADARLIATKAARRGEAPVLLPDLEALPAPSPDRAAEITAADGGEASRASLGASTKLWRLTARMFLFYAAAGCGVVAFAPSIAGGSFAVLVVIGALIGIAITVSPSPPVETAASHAVVFASYGVPAALVAATASHVSVAIGTAVFCGPLIGTRTKSRRAAGLHLGAATVLLVAAGICGLPELSTPLTVMMLLATMLVLSVCTVVVLEAAEGQAAELASLTVVDPLTGLGNRRALDQALRSMLAAQDAPVTVLALDLDGFKALNDAVGHAAGDELLCEVARCLRETAGPDAAIARPGGDEFILCLQGATPERVDAVESGLRAAIGQLSRGGHRIGTGVGRATSPVDGDTAAALLERADERLRREKYGVVLERAAS